MSAKRSGYFRRRLPILLASMGVATALSPRGASPSAGDRREAVAELLRTRGFSVNAEDVVFVDGPPGLLRAAFGRSRLVVRLSAPPDNGAAEASAADVFLFEAELSPSGVLLSINGGHNLSDTTGADETRPVVAGDVVGFASISEVPQAPSVVTLIDLRGQPSQGWGARERAQNAITNVQTTGQWVGVARRSYTVTSTEPVSLAFRDGGFVIAADGRQAVVVAGTADAGPLPPWVVEESSEVAPPGNLTTWAVDRVRAEIGDENMQAIKQTFFEAKDFVDRNQEELTGATGEADIAEDLGEELGVPRREIPVDPDLGWPPAPLDPWVTPAMPGEGQWNMKEEEAFFRNQPNLPATFLTTFIRTDRTRKTTRVYVTLWDPRQVELHMMAGTVEPKGATGKAGPGLIPRTPDVMKRVVAATNAGFQALHGEYGMMADGVVYLPPKPYAATVLKLRDGSTAFGTWPNEASVPDEVVSYRQNMTVMVQDESFNPYGRTWWGGTVPGAEDKTHTVRTGICLTKEGFVAYFYGADLSPEALSQAMIQTRCSYGLALDMNAGHSGLEFYRVAPDGELPPLGRPIDGSWEVEGPVPEMPGWTFRGKKVVKGMGLMNFPRYIKREARDYFYLTLRHLLPGENLKPLGQLADEGIWRVKGLPQHGFPYAVATTLLNPTTGKYRILAVDPRTVQSRANSNDTIVAAIEPAPTDAGPKHLYFDERGFSIGDQPSTPSAAVLASGSEGGEGLAYGCVHDESGMLYYAELDGDIAANAAPIAEVFKGLGCGEGIVFKTKWSLVLGDGTTLAGAEKHLPKGERSVTLWRKQAPSGRRYFESTPIVPKDEWYRLQQQRVRYFKKVD